MNETYVFQVIRNDENGVEQDISTTIEVGEDFITHGELAEHFNTFLTAAGFVGHDYVNYKDVKNDIEEELAAEDSSPIKVIRGDLYVTGDVSAGGNIFLNSTNAAEA